jgi:penicillin-binding protein 1C
MRNKKESAAYRMLFFVLVLSIIFTNHILPPPPLATPLMFSHVMRDRNGELLRITLSADEKYRVWTELDDFPPDLIKAILLKEDKYFFYHFGVNPVSLCSAFWQTYITRDGQRGASTISMQLARMLYTIDSKNMLGKIRQIIEALHIELYFSKKQILEAYLNLVPCGYNIEGFGAASLIYFKKSVHELTLAEIFSLCVIPQDPATRAPHADGTNKQLLEARDDLFYLWCKEYPQDVKYTTQFELPPMFSHNLPFHAAHFTDALLQKGIEKLQLTTTLDLSLQKLIEQHTSQYIDRKKQFGVANACVLLLDFKRMEVRALLGSADFFNDDIQGQVNGTNAKRSPGSTIKPFIYALGIDQGIIHPKLMLKDAPADFGGYHPDNFDGEFQGPIKAEDALIRSRNIPAVYIASQLNNPDLYDFLIEAGIKGFKEREYYGLSLVLGSAELTMKEIVMLYALLANYGKLQRVKEYYDQKDTSGDSNVNLISAEACFIVLSMLKQNPRPKNYISFKWARGQAPVYWKTGTSIGFRDSWAVGIFDNFVLAVWIGNFDGMGNPYFIGAQASAPLFFEIIDSIRQNNLSEYHSFESTKQIPPHVARIEVCSVSGQIPKECCPHKAWTWFIPGVSPISTCNIHREIYIDKKTGFRRTTFDPQKTVKAVFEFWPSDLLHLFKQAGIPRKTPPPFASDESINLTYTSGNPPQIVSPIKEIEYVIRPQVNENQELAFIATTDADSNMVYWFLDQEFVGTSKPETPLFWYAKPGTFNVRCVDDNGRFDSCTLRVVMAD